MSACVDDESGTRPSKRTEPLWRRSRKAACLALLLCGLPSAKAGPAVAEEPIRIDRATLRAPAGGAETEIRLPDSWNKQGRSGTWEYNVVFQAPAPPTEPWGLYVPRAGNRLSVALNGRQIGRLGRFDGDLSDHAQRPHFLFLPVEEVRAGRNELRFVVQGEQARYAGLSSLVVGPEAMVRPMFVWREAIQVWGSFAIICVSLVFGLIALALAVGARWRERSVALFAAACLLCALRTSYAVVTEPPFDHRLWAALVDVSYAGYLVCLCLFCVDMLKLHRRWTMLATAALLGAALVLVPLHAGWRIAGARQALLLGMVVYALALCALVIAHWWRCRTPQSRVLAAAGAVAVGLAVHDHALVFYTPDGYGSIALARFSLITFLIAMGWLLVDRQARHAHQESRLRHELADELQRNRQALQSQFERQRLLVAETVQQRERQRILQDLHDGMGLQLNGLLGLLRGGKLRRDEIAQEVHTAIEQMRMLMDSTEAFEGDVAMLLGHIRYRIEQRLRRQGIALDWDVQLATPQRVLAAPSAIALQRLVFELATNTLKHAGASRVSFKAHDDTRAAGGLIVVYADNGEGFDPGSTGAGVGTRSMERRAGDLGARLERHASDGQGVRYELHIPASTFLPRTETPAERATANATLSAQPTSSPSPSPVPAHPERADPAGALRATRAGLATSG